VADLDAQVEHVGSTSVPGLAAKPIIDVDVVVASADDVPAAIERLRSRGYVYQGDKGIKGREAFLWPRGARPHHLYVVVREARRTWITSSFATTCAAIRPSRVSTAR
jgi:GrpB-like predicted nucleotidyltransferase (UPF0157 family)